MDIILCSKLRLADGGRIETNDAARLANYGVSLPFHLNTCPQKIVSTTEETSIIETTIINRFR